jgi:haloacetate dehalogenase
MRRWAADATPTGTFGAGVRDAYLQALSNPSCIHAICEEYRAATGLDREHDDADRASGRRIRCPVLALWSSAGPLGAWYADEGRPVGLWRAWADDVRGCAVAGGHFFPEEHPDSTAAALDDFFAAAGAD